MDTLNSIENLTGSAHADILTAGAGNNTLTGGAGNDTFNVNDTGDVVSESDGTVGGVDLVNATVTYTISDADVENLTLLGSGNINGTGNASANIITGNSGINTLNGADGNDTLVATVDNVRDTLNGGNNTDTANYAAYGVRSP